MHDQLLKTILENTEKTRQAVESLQDGIARIEVITDQNQKAIEKLDEMVWKPVGENSTLVQAYAEQSVRIQDLASSIGRIDADLRYSIRELDKDIGRNMATISAKLDQKNQLFITLLVGLLTAIVGAAIGLGGNWYNSTHR